MTYKVVIFEAEGGSDKWLDGHRKDTMPIAESLREKGVHTEVLFYRNEWAEQLEEYLDGFDAYIPRVNPGSIPGGENAFFDFLRKLSDKGMVPMSHPDVQLTLGAKDALAKCASTTIVPDDTKAYYTVESLHAEFPVMLSLGERVLKQNRGSTGEGIWRVVIADERPYTPGEALPLDTKIKCTEAVDNHVEMRELGEFMTFCEQYIIGDNGMLVDMPFMPRIKEGEIRILMVGMTPVFVVHKKPAEAADAFSATLFSGAQYTYDSPEKWAHLVDLFKDEFPQIQNLLGDIDTPLIWTADFMLDDGPDGEDAYVLGEINCSCVGFTSQLDQGIQDVVADEVIARLDAR